MSCIHDKTIGSLFHVDEKEKIILEARTSLENMGFPVTYGQSQWLDAISRFSLAKCPGILDDNKEFILQCSEFQLGRLFKGWLKSFLVQTTYKYV